ncbi:ATP-binding cassette domain-containing protein [Gordonia sp. DT218]|uniref:ATP-binding cassette domain-containing protein n=1 Tax=Gordonia sp. DT218 TaxID=3416659 RepID=UPI003CFBA5E9
MTPGSVSVEGTLRTLGDQPRLTVGAAPDNDIVVDHPMVEDHHLRIEWRGDRWWIAIGGHDARVFSAGRLLTEQPVTGTAQLHLGSPGRGPILVIALAAAPAPHQLDPTPQAGMVPPQRPYTPPPLPPQPRQPQIPSTSAFVMPPQLRGAPHLQPIQHNSDGNEIVLSGAQTIGRTPGNDIIVDDMLVSRHHARITAHRTGVLIEDLGSVNGTHVNGSRISTPTALTDGAVLTIGNSDFVLAGHTLRRGQAPAITGGGLHLQGINLVVDGDKKLLKDIDFAARPGTLTAVIGPSGAGKSTVSKIAAGLSSPTTGEVTFEGRNVHDEYDALRTRIGMVPQQDVLHHKLSLRQALRYAAELRLPPDLSTADRDSVIAGVLEELQLTEHFDTRVDKLSGGQRKRASVAMELLTGPSLLILDEPTSGLDPALDRQVMATLRRLADAGRVVLVVTHSLTYMAMCDQVLLLAPGGKTAFCGNPDDVAGAMGTDDWAEIFAFVAAHPDAAYQQHLQRTRHTPRPSRPPRPAGHASSAPQSSGWDQCSTVARRQIRLIFADPGYLAFLAIMPIVLGLLTLVIPGSAGFGANSGGEAIQILIVLVIGAAFMGTALTVRDLVGERDIFERERAVGLRPHAYLAAKIMVYFVTTIIQSAVMVAIVFVGKGTPSGGVIGSGPLELFISVAALACVSTLVGLAISATVQSNEQTMPPLVIMVISQLVFSGGLFELTAPGLQQLSWLFPSYWGYATSAIAVDLTRISAMTPQAQDTKLWEPELSNVVLSYSALLLISIVLVVYTASRLRLKRHR